MADKNEQKYFIEMNKDDNSQRIDYYVTKGYQGYTVMMFSPVSYKIITAKGWIETLHKEFERIEISEDQSSVLVYYKNMEKPSIIDIPKNVDSTYYQLTDWHIEQVLIQMKEFGLSFDDFWAEYYNGTNTVYSYDPKKQSYMVTKIDVIVGSFCREEELSAEDLKAILKESASLNSLREQKFRL
jgi:hypothetical protein